MHNSRHLGVIVTALVASGLLAAGCGASSPGATSQASGTPQRGGTLTLAGVGDIDFFDPTAGYNTTTHTEERAWTRQLFSQAADPKTVDNPVPDVASVMPTEQNGGITDGGKTYTIHIRSDVMWNSAPPRAVTAQDFVRAFKRLCNPVAAVGAPGYFTSTIVGMAAYCQAELKIPGTATAIANFINTHEISGVSAPDDTTIVFHLLQPTADFLDIIAEPFVSAVPVEYLKYVPNSPQFDAHVLSDGPYEVTSYKPGQQYVMVRNPVWKASSDPIRKAYVDKIIITEGQTPQGVQQQIQAGTVDLGWDVVVPTPDLPGLYGNPNMSVNESGAVMYAVYNEQSPNQKSAMRNVAVRQALEYAIDKAAIVQAVGGPKIAHPIGQMLTSQDVGFKPFDLYPTSGGTSDPQKVRQLLAAAGYPNGLTVKLLYPNTSYNPQIAQLMQADLQSAGVNVQMVSATQTDFQLNYISNPANSARGLWDIALLIWVPDWFGINGRAVLEPMTDGPNYGPSTVDYGDYNSPVTNRLVRQALATPGSQLDQIASLWHQASLQSMKDAAFIPLAEVGVPLMKSSRVHNAVYLPINENYDITNLWLSNR